MIKTEDAVLVLVIVCEDGQEGNSKLFTRSFSSVI